MYKLTEKQKKEFEFYKYHDDDKVMFVLNQATKVGVIEFTFDKETIYNFIPCFENNRSKYPLILSSSFSRFFPM